MQEALRYCAFHSDLQVPMGCWEIRSCKASFLLYSKIFYWSGVSAHLEYVYACRQDYSRVGMRGPSFLGRVHLLAVSTQSVHSDPACKHLKAGAPGCSTQVPRATESNLFVQLTVQDCFLYFS